MSNAIYVVLLCLTSLCNLTIGILIGAVILGYFSIATAGDADVRGDRDALLETLTVTCELSPETANKVIEGTLTPWARLRWKSRPFLWRLQRDWPEYFGTLKDDFVQAHGKDILEPLGPLYGEDTKTLDEEVQDDLETLSDST